MRRAIIGFVLGLALTLVVVSSALAASFVENFSGKAIDETKWLVDNDSGYTMGIVDGALRIAGGPAGSGGPCDGIASYAYGDTYSFEINPVKLTADPDPANSQMGVVYFAQSEARGGPVVAYGFIADPGKAGKVALVWLNGNTPVWEILKSGLDAGKWYKLGGIVHRATDQIDLLLDGKLVATCDNSFVDESPKLVLRAGSWNGENTDSLEVLYRNIEIK